MAGRAIELGRVRAAARVREGVAATLWRWTRRAGAWWWRGMVAYVSASDIGRFGGRPGSR